MQSAESESDEGDYRDVDLARQSLCRELTSDEQALARSLEAIFASGDHDFSSVARRLQEIGVKRPSGKVGSWSPEVLEEELRAINDSLDAAYRRSGHRRV